MQFSSTSFSIVLGPDLPFSALFYNDLNLRSSITMTDFTTAANITVSYTIMFLDREAKSDFELHGWKNSPKLICV
jgi:hypothetical protein